jgi:hypothetical protein
MSATQAQLDANRANARHSTGPTTDEGKLASARNAVKTCLTAAKLYIRPEEQEEYDFFFEQLQTQLAPNGILQCQYFDLILHASWNIQRCTRLEAKMQEEAAAAGLDDALLDDELARKIERFWRYKKMHENTLRQSTAEFRKLKTEEFSRSENQSPLDQSVLTDTQKVLASRTRLNTADARMRMNDIRVALQSKFKPIVLPPLKDAA